MRGIGFEPIIRSNLTFTTLFVAQIGFEPIYDQGYEPCELPVLYCAVMWDRIDSNYQHLVLQTSALPLELLFHKKTPTLMQESKAK